MLKPNDRVAFVKDGKLVQEDVVHFIEIPHIDPCECAYTAVIMEDGSVRRLDEVAKVANDGKLYKFDRRGCCYATT